MGARRTGGPNRLTLVVVTVAVVAIIATSAAIFYNFERRTTPGYSNGTPISALFDASVSGNATVSGGNVTNISVTVVNGTVPLSSLQILVTPKDGTPPTLSWHVDVFNNATASTPLGVYQLPNASQDDLNTTTHGNLTVGMIFSVWVPSGVTLTGGYVVFFSTISQTGQIVWVR